MTCSDTCKELIEFKTTLKALQKDYESRNSEVSELRSVFFQQMSEWKDKHQNLELDISEIKGMLRNALTMADGFKGMHKDLKTRFERHEKDAPASRKKIDDNERDIELANKDIANNDTKQKNWNTAFMWAVGIYGVIALCLIGAMLKR